MSESAGRKRARLGLISAAAAVFAVLVLVVVSMAFAPVAGAGAPRSNTPAQLAPSVALPAALANTAIDLNRSQSAGTYVPEYVTLNNSTTLTLLPAALTVVASTCRWVTVANLTAPAIPASVFHNVEYRNATKANASGTVLANGAGISFKACGGNGYWVNYVYWTFSIYQFSTTSLATNGTVKVTFGDWPGTTTGAAPVSAPFGTSYAFKVTVSSNLTFTVALPQQTNSSTTCDVTGQVCSFTRYTFSAAADSANTTSSATIAFSVASGLRVTAAYENWSVSYTSAAISANTGIGGFFFVSDSFFQEVFVQFWYLWILFLLIVITVAAVASSKRRRG